MNIRYIDNGYYFTDEVGFTEFVAEEDISEYKQVKIRDYWEKNADINK